PPRLAPPRPRLQDGTQASDQLQERLWLPRQRGGPTKTERPESLHPERPINHHVTDHQAADPDKPGHPGSEPRPHQIQPLTPQTPSLDGRPSSDKQSSAGPRPLLSSLVQSSSVPLARRCVDVSRSILRPIPPGR